MTVKIKAFTLMELLVTVTIIFILLGLFAPSVMKVKEHSKSISCLSNIRQLSIATQLYSMEDSDQSFSGKQTPQDQNLNWLFPYAGSTDVFRCPSLRNII